MAKYEFEFSGGTIRMLNTNLSVRVERMNPTEFHSLSSPNNPHHRWVQIPDYRIILRVGSNYTEKDIKPFIEFYLNNVIAKQPAFYRRYKIRTY
jgi:transglutaminase-like putative cysteine protease